MPDTKIPGINPTEAKTLLDEDPRALLIDVRSKVEFEYVGHPVGAVHVPWMEFPEWAEDPNFVKSVETALTERNGAEKDRPLLLVCRSGARSLKAAERLRARGYTCLYNVEEGFEGDKNAQRHRSTINGWRFRGLPWEQGKGTSD